MSSDDPYGEARASLDEAIARALTSAEESPDDMDAYWRSVELYDRFETAVGSAARTRARVAKRIRDAGGLSMAQLGQKLGIGRQRAFDLVKSAGPSAPELQPVVAAIIVSDRGVLITRRTDGRPPWGFLTGEVEPGESAADAAVREAKEEAGLQIKAIRELGRRVHPDTKRTMIYLAARPVNGAEAEIGDPAELSELRWCSLDEASELLPGMFENVRAYLATALRRRRSAS